MTNNRMSEYNDVIIEQIVAIIDLMDKAAYPPPMYAAATSQEKLELNPDELRKSQEKADKFFGRSDS